MLNLFSREGGLRDVEEVGGFARRAFLLQGVFDEFFLLLLHDLVEIKRPLTFKLLLDVDDALVINILVEQIINHLRIYDLGLCRNV